MHPLKEQRDSVRDWRQIGLGIMGLADMLIKMEIRYGSKEAVELCEKIGFIMANEAIQSSLDLASLFEPFPKYNKEKIVQSDFFKWNTLPGLKRSMEMYDLGLRNSQLLTIAPTGSLSSMLGISGGIEPIFANYYTRKTESLHGHDEYYKVYTPIVQKYMEEHGLKDDSELPDFFVTAQNLNYKERIDMQAAWQNHIDASISSTVNVPNDFTVEDTENLYLYAWEKGLKGITIFRDGCKRVGILSTSNTKNDKKSCQNVSKNETKSPKIANETEISSELKRGMIIKADDNCIGKKRTLQTGCGTLHCEAFFDQDTGDLLETYLSKGSTGGCVDCDTEYFNGREWKKISDYKRASNEYVLQYNEKSGHAELVIPDNYIVNNNIPTLNYFSNHTGLDMVLSDDHRMFLYTNYSKYKSCKAKELNHEIVTVSEYLKTKKSRHVPTTFKFKGNGIPLTEVMIRLLVAIYADGTFDGNKIIISLKKDRKKKRLRELLKQCDIGWTERSIYNTDYTYFYIHIVPSVKDWFKDKQFTHKWYDCTDKQLEVVIDECKKWDGSEGEGNRLGEFYSSKKEEADFIQFALARLGYRASIHLNNSNISNKNSYRVRWTKQNTHGIHNAEIKEYKTVDNKSYCFTVSSGLLVLRRNNNIFITGNCNNFMIGLSRLISLSARAGVDIYSIVDQLKSSGTCPSYAVRTATKHDTSTGSSCPVAVGNALIDMYKELQEELFEDTDDKVQNNVEIEKREKRAEVKPIDEVSNLKTIIPCPECGSPLRFEGGCNTCPECGYSKCD